MCIKSIVLKAIWKHGKVASYSIVIVLIFLQLPVRNETGLPRKRELDSRQLHLYIPKSFQSKELYLILVRHVDALTSHWGISASFHSPLPGRGRFLSNQVDRSITDPAFIIRRFVRIFLICLRGCYSNYIVFTMDFCLLVLTEKARCVNEDGRAGSCGKSLNYSPASPIFTITY